MKFITSISDMENRLISDSKASDIKPYNFETQIEQSPKKILTQQQVRHDLSVLGRLLINGYGGWPFHDEILKRKILKQLLNIYDDATKMTAIDFFNCLRPIFEQIPDNHICLKFGKDAIRTKSSRKSKNVGKNIAHPKRIFDIKQIQGAHILGISTLGGWTEQTFKEFNDASEKIIADAACLIVDLRGNNGGKSLPTDKFADKLYGNETRSARKVYIRATPESKILHNGRWAKVNRNNDPALLGDFSKSPTPEFQGKKPGFTKPIYILMDKDTASSAEMFLLRMRHHPYVKFVGDNSSGTEVYGDISVSYLPNSAVRTQIGHVYRELEIENFELKGLTPDIKVTAGKDALDVAITDFEYSKKHGQKHKINPGACPLSFLKNGGSRDKR